MGHMPYRINKLKNTCKQSDGDIGHWSLTYKTKSGKSVRNCHTSKNNAKKQIAAIEAESYIPKLSTFLSHEFEPKIGDMVQNSNPSCKHYKSQGEVYSIIPLENDAGTLCKYVCTNSGDSWSVGDVLIKTLDQLSPISTELWIQPKKINLSDDLKYHIDNGLGIKESIYRPGSRKHVSLIKEMRTAWKEKKYKPNYQDYEILFETNIGEVGVYNGKMVYLDFPMPIQILDEQSNHYITFVSKDYAKTLTENSKWNFNENLKAFFLGDIIKNKPRNCYAIVFESNTPPKKVLNKIAYWDKAEINILEIFEPKNLFESFCLMDGSRNLLNESEYKGKKVSLGQPQRGGSNKKYKVYVKNSKGNVIKVEFGDIHGGLTSKINNPEARKSFVARHNCESKNDKTKPGYWSCRLPRYWKQLGLKKTSYKWW